MSKNILILEGLNKSGKTTYLNNFISKTPLQTYTIKLPGLFIDEDFISGFYQGTISHRQYVPMLFGEHLAVLSMLEEGGVFHSAMKDGEILILDRSFISFFVYQHEYLETKDYGCFYSMIMDAFRRIRNTYFIKILLFLNKKIEKTDDWIEKTESKSIETHKQLFRYYTKIIAGENVVVEEN